MVEVQHVVTTTPVQPFCFRWRIESYSFLRDDEKIPSEQFVVAGPQDTKWQLWLYPKGNVRYDKRASGYTSISLQFIPDPYDQKVTAAFSFSIQNAAGREGHVRDDRKAVMFEKGYSVWTCPDFINNHIFQRRTYELIPKDVLTLICRGKILVKSAKRVVTPEEPQQVSIQQGLASDFERMLKSDDSKDVMLVVAKSGIKIRVHKFVLCARSAEFASLFERSLKVRKTGRVVIEGFSTEAVQGMVHFMYTDQVPPILTHELAMEMMKVADMYKLDRLVSLCEAHVKDSMTDENWIDTMSFANHNDFSSLDAECFQYVSTHLPGVVETESWKGCTDNEIIQDICSIISYGRARIKDRAK